MISGFDQSFIGNLPSKLLQIYFQILFKMTAYQYAAGPETLQFTNQEFN